MDSDTRDVNIGRVLTADRRFLALALLCIAVIGLFMGMPTDVLPNPLFTRMTPVTSLDLLMWPLVSIPSGLLLATYLHPEFRAAAGRGAMTGPVAGLVGTFAIGCPICNKLIVMLLGTSGALTYFAPAQPILGFGAAALASGALVLRMRAAASGRCMTCLSLEA